MSKLRRLIFLGPPGVGKGTFAARVAPLLGIPAISTGDIVRAEIKAQSKLGQEVQSFNDRGELVPDAIITKMLKKRLESSDAQNGYLLDGFPRTIGQARDLEGFAHIDKVINITLRDDVLLKKLLGRRVCADCGRGYNVAEISEGDLDMPPLLPKPEDCDRCHGKPNLIVRDDDTEEVVLDRLRVYYEQTAPLTTHYASSGLLTNFEVKKGLGDMSRLLDLLNIDATSQEAEKAAKTSS